MVEALGGPAFGAGLERGRVLAVARTAQRAGGQPGGDGAGVAAAGAGHPLPAAGAAQRPARRRCVSTRPGRGRSQRSRHGASAVSSSGTAACRRRPGSRAFRCAEGRAGGQRRAVAAPASAGCRLSRGLPGRSGRRWRTGRGWPGRRGSICCRPARPPVRLATGAGCWQRLQASSRARSQQRRQQRISPRRLLSGTVRPHHGRQGPPRLPRRRPAAPG